MNERDEYITRERRYERAKRMDVIIPAQSGWYVVTTEKREDGTKALYHEPIIAWSIFEDKEGKHCARPIRPTDEELADPYLLKSPDGKYMSGNYSFIINSLTIYKDDAEALQSLIEMQ